MYCWTMRVTQSWSMLSKKGKNQAMKEKSQICCLQTQCRLFWTSLNLTPSMKRIRSIFFQTLNDRRFSFQNSSNNFTSSLSSWDNLRAETSVLKCFQMKTNKETSICHFHWTSTSIVKTLPSFTKHRNLKDKVLSTKEGPWAPWAAV